MNEELNKIKTALAECKIELEKLTTTKGSADASPTDSIMSRVYDICDGIWNYVSRLEQNFYKYQIEHEKGHLPPVQGADKLNKVLKKLELDGDYEVHPKVIYASKDHIILIPQINTKN